MISSLQFKNDRVKFITVLKQQLTLITWMYFATPTNAFFKASKDDEYNIFFLTLASSGHQDIKKSFSFLPCNFKE